MTYSGVKNVANMTFNAFRKNKILAQISEFTVGNEEMRNLTARVGPLPSVINLIAMEGPLPSVIEWITSVGPLPSVLYIRYQGWDHFPQ